MSMVNSTRVIEPLHCRSAYLPSPPSVICQGVVAQILQMTHIRGYIKDDVEPVGLIVIRRPVLTKHKQHYRQCV